MLSLPAKNWLSPGATEQKFFASVLAHSISKRLNRKNFEVVNESYIDVQQMDGDVADVIVYDRESNLEPVLMIEFCSDDDKESTITSVDIIGKLYNIKECFVFNITGKKWYRILNGKLDETADSLFFNLNLAEIFKAGIHRYA